MSLDPKTKALLRKAAREQEPSADDEARVLGALGKRIAAGGVVAAASAVAKTAPAQGVAKAAGLGLVTKILAVVGVVSAVGAGVYELAGTPHPESSSGAAPNVAEAAPPPTLAPSANATSSAPAPSPIAVPSAEGAPPVAPKPKAPTSAAKRKEPNAPAARDEAPLASVATQAPEPTPPPSTGVEAVPTAAGVERPAPAAMAPPAGLEGEIALLRDSDRLLREGNANAALAKLDEHAQRFPHGSLSEERTVSRVVVLCALGRTAEARAAGSAFLAARPSSPHAARVRGSCVGASN
ncbi:Cell division protein FtsK [Labilithrix luteola]|uniref:Cell division protein FtsK n=1 Tax=Labilithrix luteola TaxID=1391654 RepID=A0A0K1QBJ7_9BACT|nr:hypothetical protein [Labilithrix luteola]AKV02780.1 Cell division protein FtsK [Labilithrix luteola]